MFRSHPNFEQVSDESMLWRYMPFDRLKDIINRRALFFPKVTVYEDDPFEGSYNKLSEDAYITWMLSDRPGETYESACAEIKEHLNSKVANSKQFAEKFKDLAIINCWHINNHESVAMWKLYSEYENGVAICTTYGNLKSSIESYRKPIYGGKVRYIDINRDLISFGNVLAPFSCKRMSFSYENELRLVNIVDHDNYYNYDWSTEENPKGKFIPCEIKTLIQSIYTSPISYDEFTDLISMFLQENNLNFTIIKSDILKIN